MEDERRKDEKGMETVRGGKGKTMKDKEGSKKL